MKNTTAVQTKNGKHYNTATINWPILRTNTSRATAPWRKVCKVSVQLASLISELALHYMTAPPPLHTHVISAASSREWRSVDGTSLRGHPRQSRSTPLRIASVTLPSLLVDDVLSERRWRGAQAPQRGSGRGRRRRRLGDEGSAKTSKGNAKGKREGGKRAQPHRSAPLLPRAVGTDGCRAMCRSWAAVCASGRPAALGWL
ncbi:hypothetical protein NDU88_000902 [Pleurodeles waltl]|uniref:Uncharacterized protein n=1 Tax=Pleurodeles waltl TaxID=8319 RepID=A0AAV7USP0_PLEWA|nr:hypothetical protein NDU88_000902 [Pleurodeles waltl]